MNGDSARGPQGRLRVLHQQVDRESARLTARHQARLRCARGCHDCCQDELTVLPIEAEQIRRHHSALLTTGTAHPPGACAFLDGEGACRIYEHRPYVCRTQGLPLRWLEEDEAEEIVESRDICPLNAEGPALSTLEEDDCYTLGPAELELLAIQEASGEPEVRVPLRSLFSSRGPG